MRTSSPNVLNHWAGKGAKSNLAANRFFGDAKCGSCFGHRQPLSVTRPRPARRRIGHLIPPLHLRLFRNFTKRVTTRQMADIVEYVVKNRYYSCASPVVARLQLVASVCE